ncbi:hypothetical protein, partial [Burkholderia sp. SIMBA_024]|uniref:hypothetical protein n=1 Tax=Burkholderia sp. SIMBA_024 TaxID=3085768 RepID=UPI0039785D46
MCHLDTFTGSRPYTRAMRAHAGSESTGRFTAEWKSPGAQRPGLVCDSVPTLSEYGGNIGNIQAFFRPNVGASR